MIDVVEIMQILTTGFGYARQTLAEAMPLIAVACAQFSDRLTDPAHATHPAVTEAVAAACHYRLLLRSEQLRDGTTTFKAGDVSVSVSPAALLESAERLRDDAFYAAAAYFKDDGFLFAQVSA